jgi:hypothetical protein
MEQKKKASDQELISTYSELNNVWKVAERFGMRGQTVHARLKRLGIKTRGRGELFTKADDSFLIERYVLYRDAGKLAELAKQMNRTKHFICRQARRLKLTDKNSPAPYIAKWKYMPKDVAEVIFEDFKKSRKTMNDYCRKKGYGKNGFVDLMKRLYPAEYDCLTELNRPKQTMYRYGRAFEYRARDDLRKKGYFVMRAPASRSPVDLIAFKIGCVLFIQCKRSGALPPVEWNELFDLATSVGTVPILSFMPAELHGIKYRRLLERKIGNNKQRQPMEVYDP